MLVTMLVSLALQAGPAVPTQADFEKARAALDRQMLDLPSARFRDVHAKAGVVCGFVNGKNRLGAYAGWQPFVATTFDDQPEAFVGTEQALMIDTFCAAEGSPPTDRDYSNQMSAGR